MSTGTRAAVRWRSGKVATGPAPQITAPGRAGDRNAVAVTFPSPVVLPPPVKLGMVTMGKIVLEMRFQSAVRWNGTTGWMLRTLATFFCGPTPKPMMSWNGKLIRSETGFWAAVARSSSVGFGGRIGSPARAVAAASTAASMAPIRRPLERIDPSHPTGPRASPKNRSDELIRHVRGIEGYSRQTSSARPPPGTRPRDGHRL